MPPHRARSPEPPEIAGSRRGALLLSAPETTGPARTDGVSRSRSACTKPAHGLPASDADRMIYRGKHPGQL